VLNKIINFTTWTTFIIGFFLTTSVAIAQNSVPGNPTYAVKTGFEKIVLAGYRLLHKDTDYQIDLTKLRFKESQQVLKSAQGEASLKNLNLQILSTQENIHNIQDTKKKSVYAKKYVSALKEIKTQLDYEKITIVNSSEAKSTTMNFSSPTIVNNPTVAVKTTVTEQIDESRTQIDETIKELEEEISEENVVTTDTIPNETPTPIPTINTTNTERVEGPAPAPIDSMGNMPAESTPKSTPESKLVTPTIQ